MFYSFFNLDSRSCKWFTPRPGRFTPRKMNTIASVQAAGWATGPVWTGAGRRKMLASTEARTANHPACSESLYRLRYPGHYIIHRYLAS